ncbi:unnamed protein product [Rotaria sordida]|uniref:Phosphatidic acid phosphatase type 2/haloperoxidase domain-containing protein n=1 Tax=Rotaria sordida TaxID=392033 RepID=A0A819DDU8_9BILA|nr:unnamed protein product [Rotaria sordida]CAF3832122.1 unnamed protein product [Rotaria sordida]
MNQAPVQGDTLKSTTGMLLKKIPSKSMDPVLDWNLGGRCTQADPKWLPLGAPADGNGDNFTPAHPSYTSGHVVASSGTFEILRHFYRTDKISFAFESDEYNGQTKDSITGTIRPAITRQYKSFRQAEMENYYARVWLGVHWPFDERHAQIAAHKIASIIYKKLY